MIHNYELFALCTGKHCINAGFFCTGRKPRTCFFRKARQLQSLKFYQFQPLRTSHCSIRLSFILGSETDNKGYRNTQTFSILCQPNVQPKPKSIGIHCCICIIFVVPSMPKSCFSFLLSLRRLLSSLAKNLAAVNGTTMTVGQEPSERRLLFMTWLQ